MDNQLKRLIPEGKRAPSPPTVLDLPELARGLTAASRGTAHIGVGSIRGRRFVRITGHGINVVVFKKDWAKISPYIEDGTFNPWLFPVEAGFKTFDPNTRFDSSHVDVTDPLYNRILGVLQSLFTTQVPDPAF